MLSNKPFHHFSSDEEKNLFLQKYKLRSENPKKEPIYLYKGRGIPSNTVCEIIGYEQEYSDSATLVIDYGEGPCFIHSAFLKQMQSSSFNIDKTAD